MDDTEFGAMNIVDYVIDRLVEDAVSDASRRGEVVPVAILADEIISAAGCSTGRRRDLMHRLALLCGRNGLPVELRETPARPLSNELMGRFA